MNSSTYLLLAVLACIGTICSGQFTCLECSYKGSNPKESECWTDPLEYDDTDEVECSSYCYSETFQSGGPSDDSNYWFVNRGCAGPKDATCSDSDNCKNDAWGACKRCCSGNKCNVDSPSGSNMVKASLLVALSAAVLSKLLY